MHLDAVVEWVIGIEMSPNGIGYSFCRTQDLPSSHATSDVAIHVMRGDAVPSARVRLEPVVCCDARSKHVLAIGDAARHMAERDGEALLFVHWLEAVLPADSAALPQVEGPDPDREPGGHWRGSRGAAAAAGAGTDGGSDDDEWVRSLPVTLGASGKSPSQELVRPHRAHPVSPHDTSAAAVATSGPVGPGTSLRSRMIRPAQGGSGGRGARRVHSLLTATLRRLICLITDAITDFGGERQPYFTVADAQWVVTVPDGTTPEACTLLRQCAQDSGLIGAVASPALRIIDEGDATVLHAIASAEPRQRAAMSDIGREMIVVDAGGRSQCSRHAVDGVLAARDPAFETEFVRMKSSASTATGAPAQAVVQARRVHRIAPSVRTVCVRAASQRDAGRVAVDKALFAMLAELAGPQVWRQTIDEAASFGADARSGWERLMLSWEWAVTTFDAHGTGSRRSKRIDASCIAVQMVAVAAAEASTGTETGARGHAAASEVPTAGDAGDAASTRPPRRRRRSSSASSGAASIDSDSGSAAGATDGSDASSDAAQRLRAAVGRYNASLARPSDGSPPLSVECDGTELVLSPAVMTHCLDAGVSSVVRLVRGMVVGSGAVASRDIGDDAVRYVVLSGGFGESAYLQRRLAAEVRDLTSGPAAGGRASSDAVSGADSDRGESKGDIAMVEVLCPPHAGLAASQGAVRFGLAMRGDGDRRMSQAVGIAALRPFRSGIDADRRRVRAAERTMCDGAVSWFCTPNQEVGPDDAHSARAEVVYPRDDWARSVCIQVVASAARLDRRRTPLYADGATVTTLGRVIVQPVGEAGQPARDKPVRVTMHLSPSTGEVTVVVRAEATGTVVSATYVFDPALGIHTSGGGSAAAASSAPVRPVRQRPARSLDLCFAIDVTSSMRRALDDARNAVRNLLARAHWYAGLPTRVSVVAYRDYGHDESRHFEVLPFTTDVVAACAFLEGLEAKNYPEEPRPGRAPCPMDTPEDVLGALQRCLRLEWKSERRMVLLIGDSPAHGSRFHDFGDGPADNFASGVTPTRVEAPRLFAAYKRRLIHLRAIKLSDSCQTMYVEFDRLFNGRDYERAADGRRGDWPSTARFEVDTPRSVDVFGHAALATVVDVIMRDE